MSVDVNFLGHATVMIKIDGVSVLTDPILLSRVSFLRRIGGSADPVDYADTDIVLISHLHHDHCDLRSLYRLHHSTVVVPRGSGAFIRARALCSDVIELGEGESREIKGLTITAVHADHDGARVPFGPVAQALGYVISGESESIYFAGDTDIYGEMADLGGADGVDLAFIPVWGWGPNLGPGHMNPQRGAQALQLIEPKIAIPIHWGGLHPAGLSKVMAAKHLLDQPPLDFAQEAADHAGSTKVIVLNPGEGIGGVL